VKKTTPTMKLLLLLILTLLLSCLIFSLFFSSDFAKINSEIDFEPEKTSEDVTSNISFLEELKLGANPICLRPTKNCQSDNAEIVKLAKSLTNGKSKHDGAVAIFNWLKANIHYEEPMYYNTKYGALGTLTKKKGFFFLIVFFNKIYRKLLR